MEFTTQGLASPSLGASALSFLCIRINVMLKPRIWAIILDRLQHFGTGGF